MHSYLLVRSSEYFKCYMRWRAQRFSFAINRARMLHTHRRMRSFDMAVITIQRWQLGGRPQTIFFWQLSRNTQSFSFGSDCSLCVAAAKPNNMNTKSNNLNVNSEISALLIELIKGMEIIYNQNHPDYKNKSKRGKVWKSITNVINESFRCSWSECILSCLF